MAIHMKGGYNLHVQMLLTKAALQDGLLAPLKPFLFSQGDFYQT